MTDNKATSKDVSLNSDKSSFKPLSEKQECVGFSTKVEFKSKKGEAIYVNATEEQLGCKSSDIKQALKNFKEDLENTPYLDDDIIEDKLYKHFGSLANDI